MKAEVLYYENIDAFKRLFYKDLLLPEHVTTGKIFIKTLTFESGEVGENYNFMGWTLEKDGIKYLLPHRRNNGRIDLSETLPIVVRKSLEVSYNGVVYKLIKKYDSARITAEKRYSFRTLVDNLTALSHSNKKHQKIMAIIGLTSMFTRVNFRVSTPPGFGKDSTVDVLGNLVGKAGTITSPSYPKLEERMIVLDWLVINEVVSMKKADWDNAQQFLLDACAFKPTVTKRTRRHGLVGEEIPATNLSVGLFYNDIENYPSPEYYFDYVTLDAVKDRLPAFRLSGTFTEDFADLTNVDTDAFAKQHMKPYKDFLYTFQFYKEIYLQHLHNYKRDRLPRYPERWMTNINRLLDLVDLYCESQEEFNSYLDEIVAAIKDYESMIIYPQLLSVFFTGHDIDDEMFKKNENIQQRIRKVSKKHPELKSFMDALEEAETYTEKVELLKTFNENKDYKNSGLEQYG